MNSANKTETTASLINWTNVTLYCEGQSINDRKTVAVAMNEYRRDGSIAGYFLAESTEDEDASYLGPKPSEINFDGLDEYLATL